MRSEGRCSCLGHAILPSDNFSRLIPPVALAVLLALGAAAAWAIANVFIQRAARELGDLRAMLWAQLVGLVACVPAVVISGRWPEWPDPGLVVASAAAAALGYYGMLRGFRQGPLSVITPIVATWPVSAATIGVIFLGERPTPVQLVGGLLVVVGAAGNGALGQGGEWHGRRADAVGWAIAGSVGFGAMAAGVARLTPALGGWAVTPVVWTAQWVLLSPLVMRAPRSFAPPARWAAVCGMALCEVLGFTCFSVATTFAPVAVVSPPASLSTPLTVLFAGVFLGERVGWARGVCVAVALVGTVLIPA